jgi:hypothetical protein
MNDGLRLECDKMMKKQEINKDEFRKAVNLLIGFNFRRLALQTGPVSR